MKSNFDYLPDNVALILSDTGMTVRVSLNISKDLLPYIKQNNVALSKKGIYVYFLKQEIPTKFITLGNIELIYKKLLARAMSNVRFAKSVKLDHEAKQINMQERQIKLQFHEH